MELAVEMLNELEDIEPREAIDDFGEADRCCLEDWPRDGRPFRNIVLEYMQRAREAGTDAEAGFCAVISDYLGIASTGMGSRAERYWHMFGLAQDRITSE